MIYSVQGDILELKNTDGFCLVAVKSKSGIGFEVKVSHKTAEKIQNESEVFLYTEFILRENSMELFGFLTLEEKTIFKLLLSVSGVGPSFAISILSSLTVFELFECIHFSDYNKLCNCKGVGKKTANRIILELKDKIEKIYGQEMLKNNMQSHNYADGLNKNVQEAIEALVVLGYGKMQAKEAVLANSNEGDLENLVKKALLDLNKRQLTNEEI